MTVSIIYHTRFGNNAAVAELLSDELESKGHGVSIHPVNEAGPSEIPASDLYIIGSPTQIGSLPIKVARFLKRLKVPSKSLYSVFCTHAEANSGAAEKIARIMDDHGSVSAAEPLLLAVKDLKGPLEIGWEEKLKLWTEKLPDQVS